ncbi:MAG: 3D domain-containing protein [Bacteroidota bacterium]
MKSFITVLLVMLGLPVVGMTSNLDRAAFYAHNDDIVHDVEIVRPPPAEEWLITAYCACTKCCGRWAQYNGGGWTASGARVKEGVTVAVDPKVVPLQSVVIVEGHPFLAQDTGSAVTGHHVDVYFGDHGQARLFGVQRMAVTVIRPTDCGYGEMRRRVGQMLLASRWAGWPRRQ